mmetsp:Transcript_33283/g.76805  ORF Transcript_33283/g.76805 Transcript_33283/m.76805 type:complete len:272 (+) Transcript_33283:1168-1983(+)
MMDRRFLLLPLSPDRTGGTTVRDDRLPYRLHLPLPPPSKREAPSPRRRRVWPSLAPPSPSLPASKLNAHPSRDPRDAHRDTSYLRTFPKYHKDRAWHERLNQETSPPRATLERSGCPRRRLHLRLRRPHPHPRTAAVDPPTSSLPRPARPTLPADPPPASHIIPRKDRGCDVRAGEADTDAAGGKRPTSAAADGNTHRTPHQRPTPRQRNTLLPGSEAGRERRTTLPATAERSKDPRGRRRRRPGPPNRRGRRPCPTRRPTPRRRAKTLRR